jgi:hypothetical protein
MKTPAKLKTRTLKTGQRFQISKKPFVRVAEDERLDATGNDLAIPRQPGARILFAIARDPRTIFASWNIDWTSLFEKVVPIDRQVHLRVYGAQGVEKTVAVEPLAAMHYVTTSGNHPFYRVEIGYYEPAGAWNRVATSHDILMPRDAITEAADVDLATIPFHIGFQQLLDLFKPRSEIPLAVAISRLQVRALTGGEWKRLSREEKLIFRKLGMSLSDTVAARRAFVRSDAKTLARRTRELLMLGGTSPSRAFKTELDLAAS